MALRQEQWVFVAVVGLLALYVGVLDADLVTQRGAPRRKALEPASYPAPSIAKVLPGEAGGPVLRDLLVEPSNARPMERLELVAPPLAPLPALAPPPAPGPDLELWPRWLREPDEVTWVPGLFAGAGSADAFGADFFDEDEGPADTLAALREMGLVPDEDEVVLDEPDRASLYASYKRVYDWIQLDEFDYHFGSIENRRRYRITEEDRLAEPIQFSEVDPETGQPRYPGQGTQEYERARVTGLGFADTTTNRVELGAIAREGQITRGTFLEVLAFADWCVEVRHEAPRALEVARDLYTRLDAFDRTDPIPSLGLGACLEVGFDFEAAFALYGQLLERFPSHPAVLAAMAGLEERFLLFDQAEQRLRDAVRFDRGSWRGQWALGSFLLRRSRPAEAAEHLGLAERFAPESPEAAAVRGAVRADLAAAQLALGSLGPARASLESALGAVPTHQGALAMLYTLDRLEGVTSERDLPDGLEGLTPEVLLARGLWRLEQADWDGARDDLQQAAAADPLRSHLPLRALSRLAERTGNDEEAIAFAEEALLVAPGDAWTHYQLGRLLYLRRDDLSGAAEALGRALAADVDLVDAVVLRGDLALEIGAHEEAELYFERAALLEGGRPDVDVRRGLNALHLGDVAAARQRFEAALASDPEEATAMAGLAWCTYLEGRAEEALNLLAGLDDRRRTAGDGDPWRAWARSQKQRLEDHLTKRRWVDEFDRQSLLNDWLRDEGDGPVASIVDEHLVIEGQFARNGEARVFQRLSALLFVSLEATVTVSGDSAARAGMMVAREQDRGGERVTSARVSLSRHKDGSLQTHVMRSGRPDPGPQDVTWMPFPANTPVRVRVQQGGLGREGLVDLYVDGTPVLEGVQMPSLSQSSSALTLGFFVEGESGRRVRLEIDDVEIVSREP